MPLPRPDIDSAAVFLCENILIEQDSVVSAIRIVDVFWVAEPPPDIPIERTAVMAQFVGTARFKFGATPAKYSVQFKLIRPNGEEKLLHDPIEQDVHPTVNGTPAAITHMVKVGIIPRMMGVHYAVLLLDGHEMARSSFTLLRTQNPA